MSNIPCGAYWCLRVGVAVDTPAKIAKGRELQVVPVQVYITRVGGVFQLMGTPQTSPPPCPNQSPQKQCTIELLILRIGSISLSGHLFCELLDHGFAKNCFSTTYRTNLSHPFSTLFPKSAEKQRKSVKAYLALKSLVYSDMKDYESL